MTGMQSMIEAIDVHGHYGVYHRDGVPPMLNECLSGDASTVVARATQVGIRATIVSPHSGLMPHYESTRRRVFLLG